jgi:hypothetical protein
MRHFLRICSLAFATLVAGLAHAQSTIGPPNLFGCNKTAIVSAAATTTKIVTEVTGQGVHICGYTVAAGAAVGGWQIISGTGATCGTGTINITAAYTIAINTGFSSLASYAQYSTASGQAICVITTGTGPTSLTLYFAQF